MVVFLFVFWLLDVARADKPSLEQQVPADLTRALESTELLGPADLADLGTRAVADLKTIEADIQRLGGKHPECVKAPLQVVTMLRTLTERNVAALNEANTRGDRSVASASVRKALVAVKRARELHTRVVACTTDEGEINTNVGVAVEYLGDGDRRETFTDTLGLVDADGDPLEVVDVETDGEDAPPEASPFI